MVDSHEDSGAASEPRRIIEGVLCTIAVAVDDWRQQRMFLLGGYASFISDTSQVRPAFQLRVAPAGDILLARACTRGFFNTDGVSVHVDTATPVVLSKEAGTSFCLAVDATVAHDGFLYYLVQAISARSIPGSSVAVKGTKSPLYGSSVVITTDEAIDMGPLFLGIDFRGRASGWVDPFDVARDAEAWRRFARSQAMRRLPAVDPALLPRPNALSMTVHRGYLFLAALARDLDSIMPEGRFMEAVRKTQTEADRHAHGKVTSSRVNAIACSHILGFLSDPNNRPEYNDGWTHEKLVKHLREIEPDLFKGFDETQLGKALSRLRVGLVKRHPFKFPDGKYKWRSYVTFSDDDKSKMAKISEVCE